MSTYRLSLSLIKHSRRGDKLSTPERITYESRLQITYVCQTLLATLCCRPDPADLVGFSGPRHSPLDPTDHRPGDRKAEPTGGHSDWPADARHLGVEHHYRGRQQQFFGASGRERSARS